jgi:3-keto-5-aminohexanoate cleavage enzyme
MNSDLARKIVVSVAPAARHKSEAGLKSGARATSDHSALDVSVMTPEEIAADVINCAKEGATLVHLHIRDKDGKLCSDVTEFTRTIKLIQNKIDIIIEGSTGGVSDMNTHERGVVLDIPELELAALNMGSVNINGLAFVNAPADIRILCKEILKKNIVPILEIFEPGMVENVNALICEGVLKPPYIFGICFGFEGTQPARTINLQHMVNLIPKDAVWYYQEHGMHNLAMCAAAIAAGARIVRVGFEDSVWYNYEKCAQTNVEIVNHLVKLIKALGFEVASVEEARKIIGIVPKSDKKT